MAVTDEYRTGTLAALAASVPKIDTVDKRIIEALQQDGRCPFTRLARDLGISEAAVRARVRKLTDAGVIQVVAVTNPLMLGFGTMSIIGVQTDANLQQVADHVARWEETSYVVIAAGSFDLLVEVVCVDNKHLLEVVRRLREVQGVRSTETFMYLDLYKQTFGWGTR
jgi:Lrp/AsnC family transcriptional regulator, regulator for asnA, asnC and gidA